jgi:predicted RNase H-like HicB family nuclease
LEARVFGHRVKKQGERAVTERKTDMARYRYLIIAEKANGNYSAYVPDLPGCITTGKTLEEIHNNMQEAIELHLEGMRKSKEPIPVPVETIADYVEVEVPDQAAVQ